MQFNHEDYDAAQEERCTPRRIGGRPQQAARNRFSYSRKQKHSSGFNGMHRRRNKKVRW